MKVMTLNPLTPETGVLKPKHDPNRVRKKMYALVLDFTGVSTVLRLGQSHVRDPMIPTKQRQHQRGDTLLSNSMHALLEPPLGGFKVGASVYKYA
jgi:hypothetical protein